MSVTGILIVIALMLALQIDKLSAPPQKTKVSGDAEPADASPEELANLEKAILTKKTDLEEMQSSRRTTETEVELSQDISRLEEQITRLSSREIATAGPPPGNLNIEEIKSQAAEIIRLRHEIRANEDKMAALEPGVLQVNQNAVELENKVKVAEASVAQIRLEKRKLKLIRELSDTTKEPIIVDVSGNHIRVMRFDRPEPVEMATVDGFERYLKACKKDEQYFVLYFRPSGATFFEQLRRTVKNAGFEVGYDATEENFDLSLGKADKP